MRKTPVAIAVADIHLTLKPPIARAGEPDWLEAQARPLEELRELGNEYQAPIVCAGDIFDSWYVSPELINWALEHLPFMFTIPGQHDLPNHRRDLIQKSAYWTLVEARKIEDISDCISPVFNSRTKKISLFGFPWGSSLTEIQHATPKPHIALVHQYVWMKGKGYPGAPEETRIRTKRHGLENWGGWDVVIYGDNHQGFLIQREDTTIFNCGTLQRRKSDEIDYKPQVGLIFEDGTVEPHYLDCSADIITETAAAREPTEDMDLKDFLDELTKLQDTGLDFREAMKRVLEEKKPSQEVREMILEAMG